MKKRFVYFILILNCVLSVLAFNCVLSASEIIINNNIIGDENQNSNQDDSESTIIFTTHQYNKVDQQDSNADKTIPVAKSNILSEKSKNPDARSSENINKLSKNVNAGNVSVINNSNEIVKKDYVPNVFGANVSDNKITKNSVTSTSKNQSKAELNNIQNKQIEVSNTLTNLSKHENDKDKVNLTESKIDVKNDNKKNFNLNEEKIDNHDYEGDVDEDLQQYLLNKKNNLETTISSDDSLLPKGSVRVPSNVNTIEDELYNIYYSLDTPEVAQGLTHVNKKEKLYASDCVDSELNEGVHKNEDLKKVDNGNCAMQDGSIFTNDSVVLSDDILNSIDSDKETIEKKKELEAQFDATYLNVNVIEVDSVYLQFLDKISGKVIVQSIDKGETVQFGNIFVKVLKAFKNKPNFKSESMAYVVIKENDKLIFKNWLYSSSPVINIFQHPMYDIRIEAE